MAARPRALNRWLLVTGFWMLGVFACPLPAQLPQRIPPGGVAQLQIQQTPVDVSLPDAIIATAEFDPPTTVSGRKAFYRVTLEAVPNSVQWPEQIPSPPGLQWGRQARGELTRIENNKFHPLTALVYEVMAAKPGNYSLSNLTLQVAGRRVAVPAASLVVLPDHSAPPAPARQLVLDASEANLYPGQPFRFRMLCPVGPRNEIEALREIQINGVGFITDRLSARQAVETTVVGGEKKTAFVYETVATPISAGTLEISAQAFTAGRDFSGPISISGQVTIPGGPTKNVLLISDVLRLNVRPLPADKELPGFTGAVGKFIADVPQLSTNRIRVGEPVHLKFGFQNAGGLARLVPPEMPRSRDWQIIPDSPPGAGCTLIPLTDEATNTPAIPFCTFDPVAARFTDQTIPSLPVTVIGESLPTQLSSDNPEVISAAPAALGRLTDSPGKSVSRLQPLQLQGWFVAVQLLPVAGFIALWRWDVRRRFLEAHPEIVRRRQAKRALRREIAGLQKAAAAGDRECFTRHAAAALRIAVAPHFPADARALVGADVVSQLDEAERCGRHGETVRKIFTAADAQFASSPQLPADLLALRAEVKAVLQKMEEKL
jgi:hypothetical protein